MCAPVIEYTSYGGVCLFYHCSLHARLVTFIDYSTFQFVSAYFTGSAVTILVIDRCISTWLCGLIWCVLRWILWPSWTHINVRYDATSLIIAGDLNIHLDDVTFDSATVKFLEILDQQSRSTCDRSNTVCWSLSRCPHHTPWTVRPVSSSFFTDAVWPFVYRRPTRVTRPAGPSGPLNSSSRVQILA